MDKKEIKKDIKTYASLKTLLESDGGKILTNLLKKDISNTVENISSNYKTLTHIEFISLAASISERMNILRVLDNSKTNLDLAREALEEVDDNE